MIIYKKSNLHCPINIATVFGTQNCYLTANQFPQRTSFPIYHCKYLLRYKKESINNY